MNNIFWIIGVIVVVIAVLSFFWASLTRVRQEEGRCGAALKRGGWAVTFSPACGRRLGLDGVLQKLLAESRVDERHIS
jgi:hypothetical protein